MLSLFLRYARKSNLIHETFFSEISQGDSGAPLFKFDNDTGTYYQIGIVSLGEGCARPNRLSLYTRISTFAKLIERVTGGEVELFPKKTVVANVTHPSGTQEEQLGEI